MRQNAAGQTDRNALDTTQVEEVILGCVAAVGEQGGNIARIATLVAGFPNSVPGIQICDLLPMSAKIQHKYSIIRSLHHGDAGHSAGDQIMFTGYNPLPAQNFDINAYPSCGSIVAKELGDPASDLPSFVRIGAGQGANASAMGGAGILGVDYDPLTMAAVAAIAEVPSLFAINAAMPVKSAVRDTSPSHGNAIVPVGNT